MGSRRDSTRRDGRKSRTSPKRRDHPVGVGVLYEIWWPEDEPVYGDTPLARLGLAPPSELPDGSEVHGEVLQALGELGYRARRFILDGTNESLFRLARSRIPLFFNLVESYAGDNGKDFHVAAYLEMIGRPFTGSSSRALYLGQDKAVGARILEQCGIPVPRFDVVSRRGGPRGPERIPFPAIVKPVSEDGSIGIDSGSVVRDRRELNRRLEFVHQHFGDALVQEYIAGREINASIIGNRDLEVLPLVEIDLQALPPGIPRIVGREVKWWKGTALYDNTPAIYPRGLSPEDRRSIRAVAKKAYRALGVQGYGRVDLRLTSDGVPYVIEVNPNPFIGRDSEFHMAWRKKGRSYQALIERIVELAWERHR